MGKTDVAVAVVLFAAAWVLRVPFRSELAYHWDSAQFALAIGEYNIRISQPHVPGYYLYVMLGRLVNLLVGEPHASLVWLSVCAGALLPALGYLLATALFERNVGIATAVILGTSPLCWFHSEVALTPIVDSALVTATMLVIWRAIRHGGSWGDVLGMSVLYAVLAGVRQQTAPLLLPVWLFALSRFTPPRWPKVAGAVLLTGVLCSLWFIPMVQAAGGITEYVHLLRFKSQYDAPRAVWGGGGIGAVFDNIDVIGRQCWVGLMLAVIVTVAELGRWVFLESAEAKRAAYSKNREQLGLLLLWISPMLLFWLLMYVTPAGHILCAFPAIAILAGLAVGRCVRRATACLGNCCDIKGRWRQASAQVLILVMIGAVNLIAFVWRPTFAEHFLTGTASTAVDIQKHDLDLARCFEAIRANYRPEAIVICHWYQSFHWGFRQFEYHVPEYPNAILTRDASLPKSLQDKMWWGFERRTTFFDSTDQLAGRIPLFVVPPGQDVSSFRVISADPLLIFVGESGLRLYQGKETYLKSVQKLNTLSRHVQMVGQE